MVHNQKSKPYNPQADRTVKAFNEVLGHALTKVCNVGWDDWDHNIPAVLWTQRTTYKGLTKFTPFQLFYGKEAMVPIELLVPSLYIALATKMINDQYLQCMLNELMELEEDIILAGFSQ